MTSYLPRTVLRSRFRGGDSRGVRQKVCGSHINHTPRKTLMTGSQLTTSPTPNARHVASRHALLVLATSGSGDHRPLNRWDDETDQEHRARAVAADGASALGFPETTFHRLSLPLPVLETAASAAQYAIGVGRCICGGPTHDRGVLTIRMSTLDDEAHYAGETCEENGCPEGRCEGRANIDCEACVRDPLIEPNLKRCDWCRRDGVQGEALAAIAFDGVVVLTSQCAACVTHARGGRLPMRL